MGQLWKPITKLPLKNHFGCNLQLININHTIIPVIFGILYHLTSKLIFFLVSIRAFNPKGPKFFFTIILHLFERRVLNQQWVLIAESIVCFFFSLTAQFLDQMIGHILMLPRHNFFGGFNTHPKCVHDMTQNLCVGHHPSFSRNMDWAKARQGKKMQAVQNAIETNC